jgi:hypothetical protein
VHSHATADLRLVGSFRHDTIFLRSIRLLSPKLFEPVWTRQWSYEHDRRRGTIIP